LYRRWSAFRGVDQKTVNPELGKWLLGGIFLLLPRFGQGVAWLRSGDGCGFLARPMFHRGEVLVVCGEFHLRFTKELVFDGAPPDLGTWFRSFISLATVEMGDDGCGLCTEDLRRFFCIFSFGVFCVKFLGELSLWYVTE
jgi:hypothetical protein